MPGNLGFLTVVDQTPSGLIGGYLVLNQAGRPLEFHCTIPLQPDKIQQILYGNTLKPFIYGERIAQTLVLRSKLPVFSILTNHSAILPVQTFLSTPVIYVFGKRVEQEADLFSSGDTSAPSLVREISDELNESLKTFGIDNTLLRTRGSYSEEMPKMPNVPGLDTEIWQTVHIGNRMIAVPETEKNTQERLVEHLKESARTIDLLEPFDRIRLALDEANNAA